MKGFHLSALLFPVMIIAGSAVLVIQTSGREAFDEHFWPWAAWSAMVTGCSLVLRHENAVSHEARRQGRRRARAEF